MSQLSLIMEWSFNKNKLHVNGAFYTIMQTICVHSSTDLGCLKIFFNAHSWWMNKHDQLKFS